MGELIPFPRAHAAAQQGVLGCRCPISLGRFLPQPGCPVHGSGGTVVATAAVRSTSSPVVDVAIYTGNSAA